MEPIERHKFGNQGRTVRITVTTLDLLDEAASRQTCRSDARQALIPLQTNATEPRLAPQLSGKAGLRGWSPLAPFAAMGVNYRFVSRALGRSGRVGIAFIFLSAGMASITWRHSTLLIGVGGGLIVAGILLVQTGAYREYLAAIESAHGMPSLGTILRYNVDCVAQRIRALWRR